MGIARMLWFDYCWFDNDRDRFTVPETIALITLQATADRTVVNSPTFRVGTARSRTRIDAFLVDTSAV